MLEVLKRLPPLTDVDMSLTIGARLRGLREDTGLFIYQLAELAGVARETIRSIEHNQAIPRTTTALKLTRVFCLSPGAFLISPEDYASEELTVKFRKLRYVLGLKQEDFAQLCEIDPACIRDWELGVRELSRKSRYLIESLLAACAINNNAVIRLPVRN